MGYAWYSRLFGILDFLWCTFITSAVTCLSFVFVGYVLSHFKSRKEEVMLLVITVFILIFCYFTLLSTVGLINATSEHFRQTQTRIRWCIFWLSSSWTWISLWMIYFLYKIFVTTSWHILDVLFVTQFLLRAVGIYCVNRYIMELKADIRRQSYTDSMIPLTAITAVLSATNRMPPMSVYSIGVPQKPTELPNYEELMQNEPEKSKQNTIPPSYSTVVLSDSYL